jgi:hypothetical protein
MTPGTDYSRLSTDELIERLRTARIDDHRLVRARRLLNAAHRQVLAGGTARRVALGHALRDYVLASQIIDAGDRLSWATPPWAGPVARERLLALAL